MKPFGVFTKKRIFEKCAICIPANFNSYRISRRFSTHIIEPGIFHVKRTIARHEKHQGRNTAQQCRISVDLVVPASVTPVVALQTLLRVIVHFFISIVR